MELLRSGDIFDTEVVTHFLLAELFFTDKQVQDVYWFLGFFYDAEFKKAYNYLKNQYYMVNAQVYEEHTQDWDKMSESLKNLILTEQ